MARIRTIKPEFFRNDTLADLGPVHQLLFAGLWCLCDSEGRTKDNPRSIKAELFPYYDADVNLMLDDLANSGFIVRYVVESTAIVAVCNFKKHQRISGKEADAVSPLPAPPQGLNGEAMGKHPGSTRNPRKGREGKGVGHAHAHEAANQPTTEDPSPEEILVDPPPSSAAPPPAFDGEAGWFAGVMDADPSNLTMAQDANLKRWLRFTVEQRQEAHDYFVLAQEDNRKKGKTMVKPLNFLMGWLADPSRYPALEAEKPPVSLTPEWWVPNPWKAEPWGFLWDHPEHSDDWDYHFRNYLAPRYGRVPGFDYTAACKAWEAGRDLNEKVLSATAYIVPFHNKMHEAKSA